MAGAGRGGGGAAPCRRERGHPCTFCAVCGPVQIVGESIDQVCGQLAMLSSYVAPGCRCTELSVSRGCWSCAHAKCFAPLQSLNIARRKDSDSRERRGLGEVRRGGKE
eukprot:4700256-Prymnesium_polylepis.2